MKKLLFRALIFLLTISNASAQDFQKIRIDIAKSYGGPASDYFSKIEYIPLETTKESLFGEIEQLIITENAFVVTDRDTRSVLFFNMDGSFIKRFYKEGNLQATGAIYNEQDQLVSIAFQDLDSKRLLVQNYDAKGNFKAKGEMNEKLVYLLKNRVFYKDSQYWVINNKKETQESPYHFLQSYRDGQLSAPIIAYDFSQKPGLLRMMQEIQSPSAPKVFKDHFYFSIPIEHKIHKINVHTGTEAPLFQLVFPASHGVNTNLFSISNKKSLDSLANAKWFNDHTILGIENILNSDDKLIFKTITGGLGAYDSNGALMPRNFIYKHADGRLIAMEKIHPDASSHLLPILDPRIVSFKGVYSKNEYMYSHISSLRMFMAYDELKGQNLNLPTHLERYFKSEDRKSNPVVVKLKLQ